MTTKITFNIECDTLADAELIAARLGGSTQGRFEAVPVPRELHDDEYRAQVQEELATKKTREAVAEIKINEDELREAAGTVVTRMNKVTDAASSPEQAFGDPNPEQPHSQDVALASDGTTLIPYDERIHTSGANRVTAQGKWARRRNLQDSFFHEVEAELMGAVPTSEEIPASTDTQEAPTHEDLSKLIARAFQPGAVKVNIMEIFQNNGVANILEVGKDDGELIAKIYADIKQAMDGGDDDAAA